MRIEDIMNLPTEAQKIEELKKRVTPEPDLNRLLSDWDIHNHDVMNPNIRKDGRKVTKEAVKDPLGRVIEQEQTETDYVNRIPLPLEQDMTNVHTAFTVGTEPNITATDNTDEEKNLFAAFTQVLKRNKTKYLNKKAVRSWLSEKEVAEYWYTVENETWWQKVVSAVAKVFKKSSVNRKIKVAVWSPFRGDKLYPLFDEYGDMIAFSRAYKIKADKTTDIDCFMTVDKEFVYKWRAAPDWVAEKPIKHNFGNLPIVYMYRPKTLCEDIRNIRNRLEILLSNYADCIDYNFFPRLVLEGDVVGKPTKGNGDMIKIQPNPSGNKTSVYYLTWTQTPESIKLEMESLFEKAYSLTNTPRISFENMKGMGQQSGTAFRYTFMGAHMAVENHAEVVEEYLQRRCNLLIGAIGLMDSQYYKASQTLDVSVEIVPYMIDDLKERIDIATTAVGGKSVVTRREGIILAGISDNVDDTLKEIEDEETKASELNNFPTATI